MKQKKYPWWREEARPYSPFIKKEITKAKFINALDFLHYEDDSSIIIIGF